MIRDMDGVELEDGGLNIECVAERAEQTENAPVPDGSFRWTKEEC